MAQLQPTAAAQTALGGQRAAGGLDRKGSKVDDAAGFNSGGGSGGGGGAEQPRKVGLVFYFYRALSEKGQGLVELDRSNSVKAKSLAKVVVATVLDQHQMFRDFFTNELTGEYGKAKLQALGGNEYLCRIYFKAFPLTDSFEAVVGMSRGVPPGKATLQLSPRLGRVERMQVKSAWKAIIDKDDCLSPAKIEPWFSQGIRDAVKFINSSNDDPYCGQLSFSVARAGPQVSLTGDGPDSASVRIVFLPSVKGQGCPNGIRLQHPLPKLLPYSLEGKGTLDDVSDRLVDGQSIYNLDMHMPMPPHDKPGYWSLSFAPLSERVMTSAKGFKGSNVIDPCLSMLKIISAEKLWSIPIDVLQTAVLWEFKKTAASVHNESELFVRTLKRLAKYMSSSSCPHFLLPNINILKAEDEDWCVGVGKELQALHDKLTTDPDYLLECAGCKKQRGRGDDKA